MITTSVLIFLTFAGSLYLESIMTTLYKPEMFILGLGFLFGFILIIAEAVKARWVWKFSTLYFSVAMANLVFLFVQTKSFLVFTLTLFFALIAFIRSVINLDDEEPELQPLKTYETEAVNPDTIDPIIVKTTEKKTKRKTTKKRKKSRKRR